MQFLGCDTVCWQLWSNIASVVSGFATVIGIILIFFTLLWTRNQLIEMNKSRSINSFFEAYKLFETEESLKLRSFLYEISSDPKQLSEVQRDKFALLMTHLNVIAYLVRLNLIQLNDYLGLYWHRTLTLWMKAKDYVYFERERRYDPTWASDLEWIANKAEEYHLQHFPLIEIKLFKRGEKQVEEEK